MDTEERLAKLEQELLAEKRRNRRLLAVAGLGVVGVLAWTLATTSGPKMIRTNHFILEDETGNVRAMLRADKDGTRLSLTDETGKTRARLEVTKNGPGLVLFGETGASSALLDVVKNEPVLSLFGETGKSSAMLVVFKDGPRLNLFGETGKVIWSQP